MSTAFRALTALIGWMVQVPVRDEITTETLSKPMLNSLQKLMMQVHREYSGLAALRGLVDDVTAATLQPHVPLAAAPESRLQEALTLDQQEQHQPQQQQQQQQQQQRPGEHKHQHAAPDPEFANDHASATNTSLTAGDHVGLQQQQQHPQGLQSPPSQQSAGVSRLSDAEPASAARSNTGRAVQDQHLWRQNADASNAQQPVKQFPDPNEPVPLVQPVSQEAQAASQKSARSDLSLPGGSGQAIAHQPGPPDEVEKALLGFQTLLRQRLQESVPAQQVLAPRMSIPSDDHLASSSQQVRHG